MKRRAFERSSEFHPTRRKRLLPNSVVTSTPKVNSNREDKSHEECEQLKLSMINLERIDVIPDLYYACEGDLYHTIREHGKQTSQLGASMQSGKRKKKKVKSDETTITQSHHFHDAMHSSNNHTGNFLRDESLSESKLRDMHSDVKALNSSLKRKKSKKVYVNGELYTNSFSGEISYDKRRKKSPSKKKRLMLQESAVDVRITSVSNRMTTFAEEEMFSRSLAHDTEGRKMSPKKKKMKSIEYPVGVHSVMEDRETCVADDTYSTAALNELYDTKRRKKGNHKKKPKDHSLHFVNIYSDLSHTNVCAEEEMQFKAFNDVRNNEDSKKSVKKQKIKKLERSRVRVCTNISDNNTCTEEEVHPEISKDEACNNDGRKEASRKKKKRCVFPDDVSGLSNISYCAADYVPNQSRTLEDIKCDPKIRIKKNCEHSFGISTDISIDNCGVVDDTHPETPVEDDKKKKKKEKKKLKTKIRERHKKSLSDLTVDLSDNDADYCSCSVDASPPCLVKQSTSHDARSLEDLFEFPSSNESFHLHLDSDSPRNSKEASEKKKKHCVFPVDVSGLSDISYCAEDYVPKHSRTLEDIKCDPKIRIKKNCERSFGVSTDISIDNCGVVDDTHPGTPVEDDKKKKKKKKKLKTKIRERHKESLSDLTMDLSDDDTDYCSCSVDASPACLVKQSTSHNARSLEDLFEFPSDNESFHLHLDSDSPRNSIQEAEMKSTVSISPKFASVDRNGNDYETLLQDAVMNKNYLTNDEILKLKNLDVVSHHHVYPLHRVDLLPCKPPNKRDREILSHFNVRNGRFLEKEDEILLRNWKMFCDEFKFEDPEPFINFEHGYLTMDKRRDFLQYLGKDLPDRPLYLIFQRFVYIFKHQKKGPFTKEEDAFILKTKLRNIARPYSVLSRILKRNRQSIYKRFKMLEISYNSNAEDQESFTDETNFSKKREKWSKSLAESVVKSLTKIMKVSSIEQLRDVKIPNATWQKVEKLTQVPHHKLRQFWNYRLHIQLFAKSPITESKIYQQIISWLHHQNPSSLKDISWKDSIHLVPGSTDWFMWEMFRRLRKRNHADKFRNLQDFIQSLHKNGVEMKDTFIPRYKVGEDFSLSI